MAVGRCNFKHNKSSMGRFIDISGKKYNRLTVIERVDRFKPDGRRDICWRCQCECGNSVVARKYDLEHGKVKSCGCWSQERKQQFDDLSGKKFGRLTVLSRCDGKNQYLCRCDCGNMRKVERYGLISGHSLSCGCYRKDFLSTLYKGVHRGPIESLQIPFDEAKSRIYAVNPNLSIIGDYCGFTRACKVRCLICGYEWSPYLHTLVNGHGCPQCAKTGTSFMENYIYLSLVKLLGDEKVVHRTRSLIGMELDIYIPDYHYAIEPGSWYWHKDKVSRDLEKYKRCKDFGVELLVIYDAYDGINNPIPNSMTFSKQLTDFNDVSELKSIVVYVCGQIGISCTFSNADWDMIRDEAYILSHKLTTDDFIEMVSLTSPDVEVLGQYFGNSRLISVRCKKCGYEYNAWPEALKKGHQCRKCGRELCAKKLSKAVRDLDTGVVYSSAKEASKFFDVSASAIKQVCCGKNKTAGGHHWEYVDKDSDS